MTDQPHQPYAAIMSAGQTLTAEAFVRSLAAFRPADAEGD